MDDTNINLLLPTQTPPCSSEILDPFWISTSSPSFQGDSVSGSTSMVNFQKSPRENGKSGAFFPCLCKEENENEDCDPCFHQPGKKRRLSSHQVKFLEKSFEVDNKLEPERKVQLAKDLGLQPRQIAIWFQNRRARFKTKQLEKDYDSLKQSHDKLKSDFDSLVKQNDKLKTEVQLLTEKVLVGGEEGKEESKPCEPTKIEIAEPTQTPSPNEIHENVINVAGMVIKQEDAHSAKSDVFDSDSPNSAEGKLKSLFEPVDSTRVLYPDESHFSQDQEDEICRILPPPCLPKLKIESYDDIDTDTCNLVNSVDDQSFWFWSY